MNHFVRVFTIAVLFLSLTFLGSSCTKKNPISHVDVTAANKLVKQKDDVVVLDVRTPQEYAMGHIKGAMNINISEDTFSKKVAKLDHKKKYIIHCAGNVPKGRSEKSMKIMVKLGFTALLDMKGGFAAWKKAGHPVVEAKPMKRKADKPAIEVKPMKKKVDKPAVEVKPKKR